jgi:hypothetical protein
MLNAEFHPTSNIEQLPNPKSKTQNPKLKHPLISWKRTLRTGCEILNEQFEF